MPLVSVIIPYFNKKEYIKQTVDSVLKQTLQDFEIVIIYDDENLEDYEYLIENFKKNPNIKVIKNPKNLGAGISRNIGIKNSAGEFLAFLDADDLWLPSKLEEQMKYMMDNNIIFSFSNYEKKFLKKKNIQVTCDKKKLNYNDLLKSCDIGLSTVILKKKLNYNDLLKSCDIGLSTVILKKKIIKNELFPNIRTQEDYVAWLRITKMNIEAYNLEKSLVIWNEVTKSLSSNIFQKISDGFKVYYVYEKFGIFKSLYFLIRLSINSLKRKY